MEKVKVLYIGGYGRSGSTLLSRMLSQLDGYISVGEICYIWERGFGENQLCGCGKSFKECEFWTAVINDAFGGFANIDLQKMIKLRQEIQNNGCVLSLLFPVLRTSAFLQKYQDYMTACKQLYRAIQRVSGDKIIIDSSKLPRYANVLKEIPDIDLNLVHLIRDSRATAYSWTRKKVRPEIHWTVQYMDRQNMVRSAVEWIMTNGYMETLKWDHSQKLTVRYEDLVTRPQPVLDQIEGFLHDHSCTGKICSQESTVCLKVDHTISGNPNRFEQGTIRIRPDVEWQEKMTKSQKYIVTTFSWPLLLFYKYF